MTVYTKKEFEEMFKEMLMHSWLVDRVEVKEQNATLSHPTVVKLEVVVEFNGYIKDIEGAL